MILFTWLKRYADFAGRSSRKEYWLGVVGMIILSVAAVIIDLVAFGGFVEDYEAGPTQLLLTLGILVPSVALSVRRLHDIGRTGWWVLIGIIPLLGGLVLFVFSLFPGQPHDNRFGSPPPETPDLPAPAAEVVT